MEPALRMGDYILVNKIAMGARLFSLNDAFDKKDFKMYRAPALGNLKRNDVVVFNYPFPVREDSIGFDIMLYYVKRCIALPGDTLEIRNSHYQVNGDSKPLGNPLAQDYLEKLLSEGRERERGIVIPGYPRDWRLGWSIREMGPFYIPQKGDTINMNRQHAVIYKLAIEWEQKKKLRWENDSVFTLDGTPITGYRFLKNYCFVSGDRMENSKDSRYWGLLPEDFIVGKVWLIWKSIDEFDEIRWDRVMKRVK